MQLTPERNEELVDAASRGDRRAWEGLVEAYTGLVWDIIGNHGLDPKDASDVSQTAWLRLAENLDRLQDPSRVGAWLASTTRRECLRVIGQSRRDGPPAHVGEQHSGTPTAATITDDLHEATVSGWAPRTPPALLHDQLDALDAWNRAMKATTAQELAAEAMTTSREMRLDAAQRLRARKREQRALIARADDQLRQGRPILGAPRPRAVIAHRNEWFRSKVTARLAEHRIDVIASVYDGADASAAVVLEQPDLLLVENLLPHLRGAEVIARAREFAPKTIVGAQAIGPDELRVLVDAGARAVFTRSTPPADVADELTACLFGERDVLTCV